MRVRPSLRALPFVASGLFALITVALGGMWIRSFTWRDQVSKSFTDARVYRVVSDGGAVTIGGTKIYSGSMEALWMVSSARRPAQDGALFQPEWGQTWSGPAIPYWCLAGAAACLTAVPLAIRRFSVRAMLLATTVAAGLLAGLAASIRG